MTRSSYLGEMLDGLLDQPRRLLGARRDGSLDELFGKLLAETTEVSTFETASEIMSRFQTLDADGKMDFFTRINNTLDVDPASICQAALAYQATNAPTDYKTLAATSEPKRYELLRRLNQAPGATAELVRMRADLRVALKKNPDLARTDTDFALMLRAWFNRGFLILRQITWDTPASILEKIIAYESVHEINSWDDLKRRLLPADRRCFAFFHPAMPGEPLIFVEVALSKGVPSSIQDVLASDRDELDAGSADTAVFYSISNCQAGLAGISFGNSLIKQVVRDLSAEQPNLRRFVTLSPIPGLRDWIEDVGCADQSNDPLATARLCAVYLTSRDKRGLPLDPVARFHLQNGAQILAIHPEADTSNAGRSKSFGTMVNYSYEVNKLSDNLRTMEAGKTVPISTAVRALARQGKQLAPKDWHRKLQSDDDRLIEKSWNSFEAWVCLDLPHSTDARWLSKKLGRKDHCPHKCRRLVHRCGLHRRVRPFKPGFARAKDGAVMIRLDFKSALSQTAYAGARVDMPVRARAWRKTHLIQPEDAVWRTPFKLFGQQCIVRRRIGQAKMQNFGTVLRPEVTTCPVATVTRPKGSSIQGHATVQNKHTMVSVRQIKQVACRQLPAAEGHPKICHPGMMQ